MLFHYLVRGVLTRQDSIVLNRQIGMKECFLPGGHIEPGEAAKTALIREFQEELGILVRPNHFLGAVEHSWQDKQGKHAEINLIFQVELESIEDAAHLSSKEPHLEFFWCPMDRLSEAKLNPPPLQQLLASIPGPGHAFWGSTLQGNLA